MGKGWICLHREIQDSWVWTGESFSRGQAWIDLLLSANHADKKVLVNGVLRTIKRGQLLTSERKLAERWDWSRAKVKRFLDALKKDEMITFECSCSGTTNGTTITVVNYDKFQDMRATNVTTDVTTDVTTNEPPTLPRSNTNNNYNNYNNDNNIAPPTPRTFTPYKGHGDKAPKTQFHNIETNHYDFAELERQLLERDRPNEMSEL